MEQWPVSFDMPKLLFNKKQRQLPIGGQNADLGGVFVTSFGEGVQYVAPALPENPWASGAWVLELKLGRGPRWWQPSQGYARSGA